MKIAYIDHSYHRKTLSTRDVLYAPLMQRGHVVDYHWDESWRGGGRVLFENVKQYDAIVNFQSFAYSNARRPFSQLHSNITYIPMLDQFGFFYGDYVGMQFNLSTTFNLWKGTKILAFSQTIENVSKSFGIATQFIRYYQPPNPDFLASQKGLHGFFWLRHPEQVSWPTVRSLIGDTHFASLHIHLASDPGTSSSVLPTEEEVKKYNITTSDWFDNKADFDNILDKANVFFAPRAAEGIGQSFLEAFVRGQCVVAPDEPTMNEYILHNHNGILYNYKNPTPVDFSHAFDYGLAGKAAAAAGYERWTTKIDDMIDFILTPHRKFYAQGYCETLENIVAVAPAEHQIAEISLPASDTPLKLLTCDGVSWEAVTWAYRLLYDREPENIDAILYHASSASAVEMVQNILNSEEYKARMMIAHDDSQCQFAAGGVQAINDEFCLEYTSFSSEISEYHFNIIKKLHEDYPFHGKKILDLGGSNIPAELMFKLGAKQFVCVDPVSKWNSFHGQDGAIKHCQGKDVIKNFEIQYACKNKSTFIIDENIEDVDFSCIHDYFDIIFSVSTFEHMSDIKIALNVVYTILKKDGVFFAEYQPIYSCRTGHHVYLSSELNFNNMRELDYIHLLKDEAGVRTYVETLQLTENERTQIIHSMFHSKIINRKMFNEHILEICNSNFNNYIIKYPFVSQVDDDILSCVRNKYGDMRYDVHGISLICIK